VDAFSWRDSPSGRFLALVFCRRIAARLFPREDDPVNVENPQPGLPREYPLTRNVTDMKEVHDLVERVLDCLAARQHLCPVAQEVFRGLGKQRCQEPIIAFWFLTPLFSGRQLAELEQQRRAESALVDPMAVVVLGQAVAQRFAAGRAADVDELADRADVPASVAAKIIDALVAEGLVHRVIGCRKHPCSGPAIRGVDPWSETPPRDRLHV
jgi:hypothetical protein